MKTDRVGNPVYQEHDLVDLIYHGHIDKIKDVLVENSSAIASFSAASELTLLIEDPIFNTIDIAHFDTVCQEDWFVPEEYKTFDIENWVLEQCPDILAHNRAQEELEEFRARNMLPLLRVLKYVVDTLRDKQVLWGVGRGSSVASYVLYLIGVHKINSIKYSLDWREFLR
jgi:DNA polymerase III alpha subunit